MGILSAVLKGRGILRQFNLVKLKAWQLKYCANAGGGQLKYSN
jgi:hypothetical protein